MHDTFGSTCHGAGRARSRNNSRNKLDYQEVLDALKTKGIAIRVASPKLVMEEAPESYKVLMRHCPCMPECVLIGCLGCLLLLSVLICSYLVCTYRFQCDAVVVPADLVCCCMLAVLVFALMQLPNGKGICTQLCCSLRGAVGHFVHVSQDVTEVVNTCHAAGISKLAVKLRPIAVIKG